MLHEKNIIELGGYFGVHLRGTTGECGIIDDESGVYLVEAMKYAISKLNENKKDYPILAGKLGYRIVDTCSSIKKLRNDIVTMLTTKNIPAIVGPATSDEAILASISVGVFSMAVLSYSATSIELADREKYHNFFRTVPSDYVQTHALLNILKHYNWTYVSTVNSDGNYGQRGMDMLISMFESAGICVSSRNSLPAKATRENYLSVIKNLNKDINARTIVLFTTAEDTNGLLKAAGAQSRFTWLSSSAWTADMETIRNAREAAKGAIILNYADINNEDFFNYFKSLNQNNTKYRWFEEFWNKTFDCQTQNCTGNEDLRKSVFFGKYAAAGAVIDAVKTYAATLECALREFCLRYNVTAASCMDRHWLYFRGKTLAVLQGYPRCKYIFNNSVSFDKYGSYNRDIQIINFNGKDYHTVGYWKNQGSKLDINDRKITWYDGGNDPPDSVCSKPCKAGYRKVQSKTKECCFTCHACNGDEILVNNTCIKCAKFELPNQNVTACTKLAKLRVKLSNHLSIIVVVESTIGIILNTLVLFLFIKHRESKVVKSSSRELSFFMLAGLYLCFISPCTFLLQPTLVRCGLRRFIFGLSLTACYTPLMLKTNRIYRIFKAARNMGSMPYLVSPASQIWICFGLLAIQLLLSVMWVVGDPPVVSHVLVSEFKMVADLCGADIFTIAINLIPCFCMLAASTVYAFKSRRFPKNYNEAFNIGVTMYVSCVLWAIFIPALLIVRIDSKNPFGTTFVIANFSNVIGLVSLAGLFGPKTKRLLQSGKQEDASIMFTNNDKSADGIVAVEFKANPGFEEDAELATKYPENGVKMNRVNISHRKSF